MTNRVRKRRSAGPDWASADSPTRLYLPALGHPRAVGRRAWHEFHPLQVGRRTRGADLRRWPMLARHHPSRVERQRRAGHAAYERLVTQVVGYVEAPVHGLALPLDVRGSAFQQCVWMALREIPAGETASYATIAEKIGSPRCSARVRDSIRLPASSGPGNTSDASASNHGASRGKARALDASS